MFLLLLNIPIGIIVIWFAWKQWQNYLEGQRKQRENLELERKVLEERHKLLEEERRMQQERAT